MKKIVFQSLKSEILLLLDITPNKENTSNLKENILIYEKQIEKYNLDKVFEYEKYLEGEISKQDYLSIKYNLEDNINNCLNEIKNIKEKMIKSNQENKENIILKKYFNSEELTKEMVDNFVKCIYIYDDNNIKIEWSFKNIK